MIDPKLIRNFDLRFLLAILLICATGLLSIYSVTRSIPHSGLPLYLKQLIWIGLGILVFLITASLDYRKLTRYAYPIYALAIVLLLAVHFVGKVGQGAQRWITLGPVNLQPSELTKVALLLVLAKDLSSRYTRWGLGLNQLAVPILLTAIPTLLILDQPDLGTALVLGFLVVVMVLLTGLKSRLVIFGILLSLMLFPFLWHFFWHSLKDYQRERLLTFLNPMADPLGTGYHVIQSKIAIGSGGLWGQGFLHGTQSQLRFLPEGHTDFVFAVFAEEWGFLGVVLLLGLYLALVLFALEGAFRAKDLLGSLIVGGGTSILVFYIFINIAMTLGIAPVVGLPLPLMSYGGSSMLSTMALLGLIMSVKMRRFTMI